MEIKERPVKTFIRSDEVPYEQVGNGVKRKIMGYDERLMMVRVEFEKGSIGALHSHYHSQITSIESGTFEVEIGAEKRVLKSGDGFYIPPNVVHGVVCLEQGVLVAMFSPMREDFVGRG
jgi:quercetin dioxygenase-like cupin family protein